MHTTLTSHWIDGVNERLLPPKNRSPLVIDLFAGCGGLALGFESAGFETIGYEKDPDAVATYNANLPGSCTLATLTVGHHYPPEASVVIGGPPCQPFSVGGLQLGLKDSRDGFPIFIDTIQRMNPDIWLFENVRGMLYSNKPYFDEILGALKSLNYIVEFQLLNAVNFGIPQNRERIIVVGHRGNFEWPRPQNQRITAGEALGSLVLQSPPESKFLTPSMDAYVAKYEKASCCVTPRDLHLNLPARTLTCRNLAGATGDMQRIRLPDGRRRRLLPREAARLQSFPDWFEFKGQENSQFNQIGNAVPPLFARLLADSVRSYLNSDIRFDRRAIGLKNLPHQLSFGFQVKEEPEVKPPEFFKKSAKKPSLRRLLNQALYILQTLGIPLEGQSPRSLEMVGLCFLAVCGVKNERAWHEAGNETLKRPLKTRDIIKYLNTHFSEKISPGSYDDIRRKHLKHPVMAGIIDRAAGDPDSSRNDPTRGYAPSAEYLPIIRTYGSPTWLEDAEEFMSNRLSLAGELAQERKLKTLPVALPDGCKLELSPGPHNQLQKRVIEDFLPRFGFSAEVLYLGDSSDRFLFRQDEKLSQLKFFRLENAELPDIVTYSETKNWIYLIVCVHSSGPVTVERLIELKKLTAECTADIVYVTAFLNKSTFRKFAPDIAWETEVWIAESPDHLIHFNGDKFLGPHSQSK